MRKTAFISHPQKVGSWAVLGLSLWVGIRAKSSSILSLMSNDMIDNSRHKFSVLLVQ